MPKKGDTVLLLAKGLALNDGKAATGGDPLLLHGRGLGRNKSPPVKAGDEVILLNGGLAQGGRPVFTLESPVDISITADNTYDLYLDSESNRVASDSDDNFKTVETETGIDFTGSAIFGIRVQNTDNSSSDTNPWMFVFTIRDNTGETFPLDPDINFTVDGPYDTPNPYADDWVDPDFDDSDWQVNRPNDMDIDSDWGSLQDDGSIKTRTEFHPSQFFETKPHYSNDIEPTEDPRQTLSRDGYWFIRIQIEAL